MVETAPEPDEAMVERVGEAIYIADKGSAETWPGFAYRGDYLHMARAAIKAMQEGE